MSVSANVPMTVKGMRGDSSAPNVSKPDGTPISWPTGFSAPNSVRAAPSEMTTTFSPRSASVKNEPRTGVIPMISKYPALTTAWSGN